MFKKITIYFRKESIVLSLVAIVLLLVSFFPATVALTGQMAQVANASIILFAVPAFYGFYQSLGVKKTILLFFALGLFALCIETVGLLTGFPYGSFVYSGGLGFKLFDQTPWTVFFAWTPIVAACAVWAQFYMPKKRLIIFLLSLVLVDMVLDVGAVSMGLWQYTYGGIWYGVPVTNFLGWCVSGIIGYGIVKYFVKNQINPKWIIWGGIYILSFWTGIVWWSGFWLPSVLGFSLMVYAIRNIILKTFYATPSK